MEQAWWYSWGGANMWLFKLINSRHGVVSDAFFKGISYISNHDVAVYIGAALIMGALYFRLKGECLKQATLLTTVLVFVISLGLNGILLKFLKAYFFAPRPVDVLAHLHFVATQSHSYASFPSGHTSFAMLAATGLSLLVPRRARPLLVLYVVLACIARVNLGQHFPADVVGGVLSALPFGFGALYAGRRWVRPTLYRLLKKDTLMAFARVPRSS